MSADITPVGWPAMVNGPTLQLLRHCTRNKEISRSRWPTRFMNMLECVQLIKRVW